MNDEGTSDDHVTVDDHTSEHDHDSTPEHESEHDHGHDSHHAHDVEELHFGVVTISSSRNIENDHAGDSVIELVEAAGHVVETRELIRDDLDGIQSTVNRLANNDDIDCIMTMGGTGVTPDDVTIEAVQPLYDKELPGFGELFRTLSFEEIGSRVIATRASAGIVDGVPVFLLPGSKNASVLGTSEIIIEEASHLAGLAPEDEEEDDDEDGDEDEIVAEDEDGDEDEVVDKDENAD